MRTRSSAAGVLFLLLGAGVSHAQGSRVVGLWTIDLERSVARSIHARIRDTQLCTTGRVDIWSYW